MIAPPPSYLLQPITTEAGDHVFEHRNPKTGVLKTDFLKTIFISFEEGHL